MSNIKKHSPPAVNFKLNEFWNIVYLENCKLLQWFKNNNNDPTQPIPILFVTCHAHEIQLQINSTLNTQGTFLHAKSCSQSSHVFRASQSHFNTL